MLLKKFGGNISCLSDTARPRGGENLEPGDPDYPDCGFTGDSGHAWPECAYPDSG